MTIPELTAHYVDDSLLVLEKPAGLLSVPGRGADKQDCASARAQRHWPDALIVHRLDMATSGLWVMARGLAAQQQLSRAFAQRLVHKRYQAVVQGILPPVQAEQVWGEINLPLWPDWPNRPKSMVNHELGKPSLTRWRVLPEPTAAGCTRLELEPVTGRSHQLRVHLLAIGHPILGDALYGDAQVQAMAPRMLLHACAIELPHPVTGDLMAFSSRVPF